MKPRLRVRRDRRRWPAALGLVTALLLFTWYPGHPRPASSSPAPPLPPALPPVVPTSARAVPPRASWKQPKVLTAHAKRNPDGDTLRLSILTTGVDTLSYGRVLTPAGCLVGEHAFPAALVVPEITICDVPRNVLQPDELVTVLLLRNEALVRAHQPQVLRKETFQLVPGDVTPVQEDDSSLAPEFHGGIQKHCAKEGGPGLASVRSELRWDPDRMMDEPDEFGPRYELCLMTAMKQYPFLMEPWFEYYRRMGVDQFFIYDNGAAEDLRKTFAHRKDTVQVIFWPWPRSQMQSNNHFLLRARSRCRFVGFFDADEFVMIGGKPLDNFGEDEWHRSFGTMPLLKRYVLRKAAQKYRQIVFHFLVMVNSGYIRRPKGDLPELYTHRAKEQKVNQGKSVIDTSVDWEYHKIHMVHGNGNRLYWNETLELNPTSTAHSSLLVHYTRRSWEDFVAKNAVGGASVMTAARKPAKLDVNKPDPRYMNESSTEFVGFRTIWRHVMKLKDDGRIVLTWTNKKKLRCRAMYCPKCWRSSEMEKENCSEKLV